MPTWVFFVLVGESFFGFFPTKITPTQRIHPSTHNCLCPISSWATRLSAKDTGNAASLHGAPGQAHRTEIIVGYWMHGNHTEVRKLPNTSYRWLGECSVKVTPACLVPTALLRHLLLDTISCQRSSLTHSATYIYHAIEYPVLGKSWWSSCPKQREGPNFCRATIQS